MYVGETQTKPHETQVKLTRNPYLLSKMAAAKPRRNSTKPLQNPVKLPRNLMKPHKTPRNLRNTTKKKKNQKKHETPRNLCKIAVKLQETPVKLQETLQSSITTKTTASAIF